MTRLLSLIFSAFVAAMAFGSAAFAVTDSPVPADKYISVGGYDWAWVSPCSASDPSCSLSLPVITPYQAGQGWMLPSVAVMDAAVAAAGGSAGWAALFGSASDFKCASAYFGSGYSHCDYNDAASGYIWNWSGHAYSTQSESFAYRIANVPVPAAGLLLLSGFAGLAGLKRRKRRMAAA